MNLHSRKVRLPIAALGVTALCTTGLGVVATSAFAAPTALSLNSGGDSFVVANLGHATTAAAATAYAQKLTGSDAAVSLDVVSGPAAGTLSYEKIASNGTATTSPSTIEVSTDEVQTVTITGSPTGGTFTLTYAGQTTGTIAYNATASAVQTALEALSNVAPGDVAVTGSTGGPYTLTFGGTLADTNLTQVTGSGAGLTGGTTPAVASATTTQGGGDPGPVSLSTVASTDYIYVSGNVPGTYTYRYFQDTNANGQLDAADERSSSLVTMTVVDAGGPGTTATTADDVAPVITSSSPIGAGQAVNATIGYTKDLTLADARGSNVATSLKAALAARTFVDVTGTDAGNGAISGVADVTNQAATYTPSTGATTYAIGTPTEAGSIAIRADLKTASGAADNATGGSRTVTVESNSINSLTSAVTLADGKIVAPSSSTATVKSGTASVTYTATAMNTTPNPDVVVPGATVYFTLGGTNVSTLTTNGTTVDAANHVFSAVTNADGVASLTVTTSAATDGTTYTVSASSNAVNATPPTITTTYADAAATSIVSTNTPAEITPEVSQTSVTLKGRLIDQFGASFQPPSSASQQVGIQIPDGSPVGNAVITNGAFSFTYTPTTPPAAGDTTTFDFTYGALSDGATEGGTIRWASTAAATSITISAPADASTGVDLENSQAAPSGVAVTGTILGAGNAGLAYKTVTLKGSDGVYFATQANPDATHPLSSTLTAVANNAGAIQNAFVFFTKSGAASITATSGSVSKTVNVTTDDSDDSYKVIAIDAVGTPGETVAITGKITDMFGNPVVGRAVALSLSDLSVGALAATNVETDSSGVWSTTLSPASNQNGKVTLTARLRDAGNVSTLTTNPVPNAAWKAAGLTFGNGEFQDTATITVAEAKLTISATGALIGGGKAQIGGTAPAGRSIKVYVKPAGATGYTLGTTVTADAQGEWGVGATLKKSTSFYAESGSLVSPVVSTTVYSYQTVKAKALGKGKVEFKIFGVPNTKGTATVWYGSKKLGSKATNSAGDATLTVQSSKGKKSFKIYFSAPGTALKGTILTGTVK